MKGNPLQGKIQKPYLWKLADELIIRAHPITTHTDWSTKDTNYKPIKDRIKDHYSLEQNDHCVYCRKEILYKGWSEPIEHIIHKQHDCQLMFKPLNLALSCKHCNTKKSRNHALRKPFRAQSGIYQGSQYYRILHPHYDNFQDYIYIEDGLFFRSHNKDKGYIHILFFELNGETMLMSMAKDAKISREDYYKKLSHKMYDSDISRIEKKTFRKLMNEVVTRRALY